MILFLPNFFNHKIIIAYRYINLTLTLSSPARSRNHSSPDQAVSFACFGKNLSKTSKRLLIPGSDTLRRFHEGTKSRRNVKRQAPGRRGGGRGSEPCPGRSKASQNKRIQDRGCEGPRQKGDTGMQRRRRLTQSNQCSVEIRSFCPVRTGSPLERSFSFRSSSTGTPYFLLILESVSPF